MSEPHAELEGQLADVQRVLVVGDVHMHLDWFWQLAKAADETGCQAIVQLGDLGYLPATREGHGLLNELQRMLAALDLPLLFVDGNHDDHDALRRSWRPASRRRVGPFVELDANLFYLPRGCRFSWRGVNVLAVGGAFSIDRDWRLQLERMSGASRTLWWPEEVLSDEDVRRASTAGPADIILAHDCPAGVVIPDIDVVVAKADENRRRLAQIVDATRPTLLLHGHYHQRVAGTYRKRLLGLEVQTVGLAHEHTGRDGWLILDLDQWPTPIVEDVDPMVGEP